MSYAGQFFHSERDVLYHYSTIFTIETLISQQEKWRNPEAKVRHRKAEGCISVEIEAATFFAVAQFRSVQFGEVPHSSSWELLRRCRRWTLPAQLLLAKSQDVLGGIDISIHFCPAVATVPALL